MNERLKPLVNRSGHGLTDKYKKYEKKQKQTINKRFNSSTVYRARGELSTNML